MGTQLRKGTFVLYVFAPVQDSQEIENKILHVYSSEVLPANTLSASTPTTAQIFDAKQIQIYPIRRYRIRK